MAHDQLDSNRLSLRDLLAQAWDVYTRVFGKIFLTVLAITFPLVLLHILIAVELTANPDTANIVAPISFCMNALYLLPNLIVVALVYGSADEGRNVPLLDALASALCRWIKVLFTSFTMLVALIGPMLIAVLIAQLVITRTGGEINLWMLLIMGPVLFLPLPFYVIGMLVYWLFAPIAAFVRNKWFVSGLSYSFRLVRHHWLRIAVIVVLLGAVMIAGQLLVSLASIHVGLTVLLLFAAMLVFTYLISVYTMLFLRLEAMAGLPADDSQ